MTRTETLLEFPCDFPVKAMGRAEAGFEEAVVTLVRQHAPDLQQDDVHTRASRGGNFVSVTLMVRATSQDQLDAIYRELTASERVLMAL